KAKSLPITCASDPKLVGLPGEHGFRFFPSFYHHLDDTLREIPFGDAGKKVLDNFVCVNEIVFAHAVHPVFTLPVILEGSLSKFQRFIHDQLAQANVQLTPVERQVFSEKIWRLMTSSDERRANEFERISWWEYMEADYHSQVYRDFLARGLTRTLVAARAERASVKTGGDIVCRLLWEFNLDGKSIDRVLNGPTNEVWIHPWRDHLMQQGVKFVYGTTIKKVLCEGEYETRAVKKLVMEQVQADNTNKEITVTADYTIMAIPVEAFAELLVNEKKQLADSFINCWQRLKGENGYDELYYLLEKHKIPPHILERKYGQIDTLSLYHLWQDAQLLSASDNPNFAEDNIKPMLLLHDPSLEHIISLAKEVEWMVGIQYYLREMPNISKGHLVLPDSPWAITAFMQTEHWKPTWNLNTAAPDCKAIFSIDISDWNTPGAQTTHKPAKFCSREEIAKEVWAQLQTAFNKANQTILADDIVIGYYLDEAITFNKEQGNRAENASPILVNTVNSWHLRPTAHTQISNFFIASDYVKTNTDLATMEGANEAAKRAVNALLAQEGVSEKEFCRVYTMKVPFIFRVYRYFDALRYKSGLPYSCRVLNHLHLLSKFYGYFKEKWGSGAKESETKKTMAKTESLKQIATPVPQNASN
ncbi:MAG: hypothetical protein RI894_885, partial [Bacteroidota bacterium]